MKMFRKLQMKGNFSNSTKSISEFFSTLTIFKSELLQVSLVLQIKKKYC